MLTLTTNEIYFNKKSIRKLVYGLLLNYSKDILPINTFELFRNLYDKNCYFNSNYMKEFFGRSYDFIIDMYGTYNLLFYDGILDEHYVFIDKSQSLRECAYTISIAIAYIETGMYNEFATPLFDNDPIIYEFANCIMAPNILLKEFSIESIIMKASFITFKNSIIKEQQLQNERLSSVFHRKTEVEKLLIEKFDFSKVLNKQ